jgi:hypothetical protein
MASNLMSTHTHTNTDLLCSVEYEWGVEKKSTKCSLKRRSFRVNILVYLAISGSLTYLALDS